MSEPAGEGPALEGILERIVFQNPTSQWTVAKIAPADAGAELVTAVGALVGLTPGTPLVLHGQWVNDKKYGRQFRVDSYQTKSPETLLGMERYLGSGTFPGIGPELAKRIVSQFGQQTMQVIGEHPERLTEVDGIGAARAEKIAASWGDQRDIQDVMVFLRGHGVAPAYAARIYKLYGADAIGVVRQNPYRLALDIWGIGFKSADSIAQSLGIAPEAPERLEAALIHVLGSGAEDGHVHVPEAVLLEQTAELLAVDAALLPARIDALEESSLVVRESLGDRGPCLSLTSLWEAEHEAARAFAELVATPMQPMKVALEEALAALEAEAGITLASEQRRAVGAAVVDKAVVITGGPGVGKTTIVRAIVTIFSRQRRRIALAAPTGRAAKRLAESTAGDALTIHRLLEYQPQANQFARNAEQPLEVDAVIVDETSMVDVHLFRALLIAMPPSAQLILVGDTDQLPSVGPGSVLADVIASEAATVVRLTEIFRQAATSHIITSAHRINRGELPILQAPPGSDAGRADFYFIEREDPVAARETLLELVADRIPSRFGFDPISEIQVLVPMHRGDLGTTTLNHALQERLNPSSGGFELRRGDRSFRVGDKVMQIRNDYDKSVFNGDIGAIVAIAPESGKVIVDLGDGRTPSYERAELDQLVHAFAISIHKSQGSEYPAVVLPLATQHYMMLQRNLLYTGITRGKQLVVLLGSRRAVSLAVRNDATYQRYTWLAERIRLSL